VIGGRPLTGSLPPFILKNPLLIHFLFFILFYSFFWIKKGFFNIKDGREPIIGLPPCMTCFHSWSFFDIFHDMQCDMLLHDLKDFDLRLYESGLWSELRQASTDTSKNLCISHHSWLATPLSSLSLVKSLPL
jgi:hypothetical protein